MRFPWANTALLVLLPLQLLTGFFGLISGTENLKWILWLHGIGGYAIVAILLWKALIILDVMNRIPRIDFSRAGFLVMAALLLLILTTGLVWIFGGSSVLFGYSLMTVHALAALALAALLGWHIVVRLYILRVPASRDRRAFLRTTGALVAGFGMWALASPILSALKLPGAARRFTGSYETGSASGVFPEVIWLSDSIPAIKASKWRLDVSGAVDREMTLGFEQLAHLGADSLIETIDCTGGWYSSQEWRGVLLGRLLDLAGVGSTAQSVTIQSATGYARRFRIDEARGFLIATQVGGAPLTQAHGAPARLVAPGRRGFEWVKWVTHVRLETTSELLQPPLPLQ